MEWKLLVLVIILNFCRYVKYFLSTFSHVHEFNIDVKGESTFSISMKH